MAERRILTFALMDAPYESARTTTALRLIDIAVRRGCAVNVFAYEGAVVAATSSVRFLRESRRARRDQKFPAHPENQFGGFVLGVCRRRSARSSILGRTDRPAHHGIPAQR